MTSHEEAQNAFTAFLARHDLKHPTCFSHVDRGWIPLLDRLVIDLKALGWDGHIDQVKEKFGGLRFYIGRANRQAHERIYQSERESLRTCEACGDPGQLRTGGRLKTLCESHANGMVPLGNPGAGW